MLAGQHENWEPSQWEATGNKAVLVSQADTAASSSKTSNNQPTLHQQGLLGVTARQLTPVAVDHAGWNAGSKRSCRSVRIPKW